MHISSRFTSKAVTIVTYLYYLWTILIINIRIFCNLYIAKMNDSTLSDDDENNNDWGKENERPSATQVDQQPGPTSVSEYITYKSLLSYCM